LAIEPNPALKAKLRKALAMPNVHIANVAVGPDHGTATLYIFKQHGRSSLLENGRDNAYTLNDANRDEPAVVQVIPLLALLELYGITRVDALKIDVEGYEDRALLPFFDDAPQPLWPRLVLIERSPHVWRTDCLARLKEQGYEAVWEGRSDTLLGYRQGS
jgi:FkbM family methyltransferase